MAPSPDDPSQSNSGLEGNVVVSSSLNLSGSRFESLSWRLGHFDHVLDALNELRSEFFTENQYILSDNEYRLSASRVMDLLDVGIGLVAFRRFQYSKLRATTYYFFFEQIAKGTLEKVGVNLWPHSLCVVGLRRHKKAYFALLKLLRSRESCLNSQMQAAFDDFTGVDSIYAHIFGSQNQRLILSVKSRSRRLTCRLSTNFSIRVNPVYDLYLPPMPRNFRQNIGQIQPLHQKALLCRSMPPTATQDAFRIFQRYLGISGNGTPFASKSVHRAPSSWYEKAAVRDILHGKI
ncbi:hypothetical protein GG344DRAFT_64419 [Lentinula edodes]|nr:hypothetical protein GG344DRAFT_64419 [Lentinula edodes]